MIPQRVAAVMLAWSMTLVTACGRSGAPAATVVELPASSAPPTVAPAPTSGPDEALPVPTAPTAPAAIAACNEAFEDQLSLYAGADADIHPRRKERFIALCASMPPASQRCASPLHQIRHSDQPDSECDAVHDERDPAVRRAWHEMFGLLAGPAEELARPPP